MLEKFHKVVNLKNQPNKPDGFSLPRERKVRRVRKKKSGNSETAQAQAIEEMFADESNDGENSLHKIIRAGKSYDVLLLRIGAGVLALIFVVILFNFFSRENEKPVIEQVETKASWSAVVLTSGEVYYGLIADKNKNPVEIANVYYDYDKSADKSGDDQNKASGNLRLVKRGKESYGPDGSMTIYQAQIKYIETLKEDSKVLKAILDHEEIK